MIVMQYTLNSVYFNTVNFVMQILSQLLKSTQYCVEEGAGRM